MAGPSDQELLGGAHAPGPHSTSAPGARDLPAALHEVGNALTVVLGWIDVAVSSLPPGSAAAEALEIARGRAALAQRLARRAIGASTDDDGPRTVREVVREVAGGVGAKNGGRSVKVEIAPEVEDERLARGDGATQVLTNLLLNAVAVSPKSGTVRIRALHGAEGFARIEVIDKGPGVPADLRATLFTSGRSSRPGGAGIGLRHAATLAAEVGGLLDLVASGPGGTTFAVTWPLANRVSSMGLDAPDEILLGPPSWPPGAALRPPVPAGPISGSGRPRLDGMHLLLLEDDGAVVDLLESSLLARGASVDVVRDRKALGSALAGAKSAGRTYDAALIDLSPLGKNIDAALGEMRAHVPKGRLVVISGTVSGMTTLPLVDAWVTKPFEVDDILHALVPPSR
jgi:CheY-like chemotaxis protein